MCDYNSASGRIIRSFWFCDFFIARSDGRTCIYTTAVTELINFIVILSQTFLNLTKFIEKMKKDLEHQISIVTYTIKYIL